MESSSVRQSIATIAPKTTANTPAPTDVALAPPMTLVRPAVASACACACAAPWAPTVTTAMFVLVTGPPAACLPATGAAVWTTAACGTTTTRTVDADAVPLAGTTIVDVAETDPDPTLVDPTASLAEADALPLATDAEPDALALAEADTADADLAALAAFLCDFFGLLRCEFLCAASGSVALEPRTGVSALEPSARAAARSQSLPRALTHPERGHRAPRGRAR